VENLHMKSSSLNWLHKLACEMYTKFTLYKMSKTKTSILEDFSNGRMLHDTTPNKTGFDFNGCLIARGKWNASSGKWKRHPTCPIGQV
jgi:hypothetical protein